MYGLYVFVLNGVSFNSMLVTLAGLVASGNSSCYNILG